MASQSADTGGDENQVHPLRPPVPPIRGKANRHPSARVFGSHVVLDDGRPRKQAARFQDLLQQPSHAYLTGRANAGSARATSNRKSPLVSLATSLSILIPDTNGCLTFQRLGLTAVSGQPLQEPRMKSSGVCVLGCSSYRGSDRFTATVSIRQTQDRYTYVSPASSDVKQNKEFISHSDFICYSRFANIEYRHESEAPGRGSSAQAVRLSERPSSDVDCSERSRP